MVVPNVILNEQNYTYASEQQILFVTLVVSLYILLCCICHPSTDTVCLIVAESKWAAASIFYRKVKY